MYLKKIDTESNAYNFTRGATGFISFIGGGFAVESVLIPFIKIGFKSKIVRFASFVGTISLAVAAGSLAEGSGESIVDIYADCWNMIADKVNGTSEESTDEPISENDEKSVKNMTPEEELEYVHKYVEEKELFEFATEEEAKKAVEDLAETVNVYGFEDLGHIALAHKNTPTLDEFSVLIMYGWTKDDIQRIGVDKITDDKYIVDAFNYHNISNVYKTL